MMWALLSCIKICDGGDIFLTRAEADKAHKLGDYYLSCYSPLSRSRSRNAKTTLPPLPLSLFASTFPRALPYRACPSRLSQPPSSAPPSCYWVMICQSDAPLARGLARQKLASDAFVNGQALWRMRPKTHYSIALRIPPVHHEIRVGLPGSSGSDWFARGHLLKLRGAAWAQLRTWGFHVPWPMGRRVLRTYSFACGTRA